MLPGKALAPSPTPSTPRPQVCWVEESGPSAHIKAPEPVPRKGPSPLHSKGLAVRLELLTCSLQVMTWDMLPSPSVQGDLEVTLSLSSGGL